MLLRELTVETVTRCRIVSRSSLLRCDMGHVNITGRGFGGSVSSLTRACRGGNASDVVFVIVPSDVTPRTTGCWIGRATAQPTSRIVNGTLVHDGEFPYMVSLRDKDGFHMCGASVIDFQWILTAAHCLNGMKVRDLSVQYGVTHISKNGPNIIRINEMMIHPEFDEENTYFADIALLKLVKPLPFSRMVRPVTLPFTKQQVIGGAPVTVMGWGFNASSNGMLQDKLQKVDYFIVDHQECVDIHEHEVQSNQICAGLPEGGKGQCIGDSGGPLVSNGVQVGIVSWSMKPCGAGPYPGVFTDVAQFVSWIVSITGELVMYA